MRVRAVALLPVFSLFFLSFAAAGEFNAEQQEVVQAFVVQGRAVYEEDFELFRSVVLDEILFDEVHVLPRELLFEGLMEETHRDPEGHAKAYDVNRIVSLKVDGDVAVMVLRDTVAGEQLHRFEFVKQNGSWKWSAWGRVSE
ncbi:MAG: hypothetical protein KKC99_08630 [Proteobacteria bacterium]|nr:hypothetical protein [Pseudomonadota bacterium]